MRLAQLASSALALICGACVRFGYEPRADSGTPAASPGDAGVVYMQDAAPHDAAAVSDAGQAGTGGSAAGMGGAPMAGQPSAGATAGAGGLGDHDAAAPTDPELGDAGLRVSDVLGYYSGDWGDMVLQARDDEIWGVYRYNDGTIVGTISSDGVFSGWWSQLPTRAAGIHAGEVEFRWTRSSAGVVSLDGRWRYGTIGVWLENWDVNLVTDRSAPPDLLAAFNDTQDFRRHP